MAFRRVHIDLPVELLEEIDQAAKQQQCGRNDFMQEALRDRVGRDAFLEALQRLRTQAANDYTEEEVDQDIAEALAEVRQERRGRRAGCL